MTAPYILTRSAAADLREVVRYTVQNWGKAQCQAYIAEIEEAATDVALGKGLYKNRDDLLPSLRVRRARHHYLFACPSRISPR